MRNSSNTRGKQGIALVLTLAILVVATILVVGFTSSMRTERQASASSVNGQTAEVVAQAAVDHAIAILDQNIPQPVPPGALPGVATNWIINPGLLTTVQGPAAVVQIPLSSNPSATYVSNSQDAELNVPLLSGSGYTIAPTNAPMRVTWVPVLRDPSLAAAATNRITGRYGFWIDDENAKININTAQGKPATLDFTKVTPGTIAVGSATYPVGHPSSVNLDILGGLDSVGLATAVGVRAGLSTIDDIRPFVTGGTPDAFVSANRFNLTAYSRSPEFNVFGKSRLYMMRKVNNAQLGLPLFQFFRDKDGPNYFPADENTNGADRHSAYYTAAAISAYLNRNDWPGMPARSFVDKWGGGAAAKREADQFGWNLMSFGSFAAGDYAAFTASTLSGQHYQLANAATSGEVGFVSINKPNKDAVVGALSGKAMLPLAPIPKVNEVCLVIAPESYTKADGTQKYRMKVSLNTELWLPPGYPSFDFAQTQTTIGMTMLSYTVSQATPGTANSSQTDAKYVDISASPSDNGIRKLYMSNNVGSMSPGSYSQVNTVLPIYVRNTTGFSATTTGAEDFETSGIITLNFKLRLFAITQQKTGGTYGTKHTSQLIPVWDSHDPATTAAPSTWNPAPPTTPAATLSAPPDDSKDYIEFAFALDPSAFGSGIVFTRSLEIADPTISGVASKWKEAASFTDATAQSVDSMGAVNNATTAAAYDTKKLAFVDLSSPGASSNRPSTGLLSVIPTGMQRGIAGATLKFQPSANTTELPDWLLLDLVSPTVNSANFPSISYGNSTAGKVGLNADIFPTGGKFSPQERWQPLQGLLENFPNIPAGETSPSTLITNILRHTLSGKDFGAVGAYDYIGEICEVAGMADDPAATDWDKEVIVRNLASTMTTQSNVFSIWGVAQTLKKKSGNVQYGVFEAGDIVTGEKRFQAVVERYVWQGVDGAFGNASVDASGKYNKTSVSQPQPGFAPPYTGGAWEAIDGPNAPTYPITTTDPWTTGAPSYTNTTLLTSRNPAAAVMKYRIVSFRYVVD